MGIEKKCAVSGHTYKLYSPDDLTKNWLISINNQSGKRINRLYAFDGISINKHKTRSKRLKAAKEIIERIIQKNKEGSLEQPEEKLSYKQMVYNWMDTQPWRKKSYSSYKVICDAYFKGIGNKKPTVENTEAFMDKIRVNRYSTTYNNYRRKLKRLLGGIGYRYVLDNVEKIREHRRPARYFQRSQMELIKPVIQNKWPDLFLYCQLMYYCYIRPKESRHLQAQHILLDSEQILIIGTEAKNADSEYVVIPDQLIGVLREYTKGMRPSDWLFPGVYDKTRPIGENTMWRRHYDILKSLSFGDGFELYSWKHTGAVQYIQHGGNPVQLSIQMRHKSLDQTMEYLRQLGIKDLWHLKSNIPDF